MLFDFETTMMFVLVSVTTVLSVIALVKTDIR
jgi:hypothetical protein